MEKLSAKVERLLAELQTKLGLSPVDARRAAFTILAVARGWPKARVGRYLGVSRARVHQRVGKYQVYAESGYPNIKKCLAGDKRRRRTETQSDAAIEFRPEDWESEEFARAMLARVA